MKDRVSRRRSTTQNIVLSLAVLGGAAGMAGLGTFATFTSSTSASESVSSGTVTIALGAPGSSSNRLSVNASGIAPGDTIERSVDLVNQGSLALSGVAVTTAASPSSLLDTDAVDGLQMTIDRCSVPWTESGTAPAYTYTCSGTTSSVVASRAVIGADVAMANLGALVAGVTDHLRVTLALPSSAGNTFQNQASTIGYTFTATQRTGTSA